MEPHRVTCQKEKGFDFIFESEFQTLYSYTRIIVELLSMLLLCRYEDYICTKRDAVYSGINVLTFLSIEFLRSS
jgi:hypothetical protein